MPIRLLKKFCFLALAVLLSISGFAQRITHGIVVDSLTLGPLQGVHVKILGAIRAL